jgi:hypothetical protein
MEQSIENIIHRSIEQKYVEQYCEKSHLTSKDNDQTQYYQKKLDLFDKLLSSPNYKEERETLLQNRAHTQQQLDNLQQKNLQPQQRLNNIGGSSGTGQVVGISIEETRQLLQQLKSFQENIRNNWSGVKSQWQNLQDCWRDRQYDHFEPYFELLCQTYDLSEQQCEQYIHFLEEHIHRSDNAVAMINL